MRRTKSQPLVMFDLDNTLSDRQGTFERWVTGFCQVRELPDEAAGWIVARDDDGHANRLVVFQAIKDRYGLREAVPELVDSYRRRALELAMPMEGARECLETLAEGGHPTAIVTNGASKMQHDKIDALNLRSMVDAVVVSGDLHVAKPDERIFRTAAEAAGAPLDGAWMVGDSSVNDIAGAARVGLETAWMRRGRTWTDTAVVPTLVLDRLDRLVQGIADRPVS